MLRRTAVNSLVSQPSVAIAPNQPSSPHGGRPVLHVNIMTRDHLSPCPCHASPCPCHDCRATTIARMARGTAGQRDLGIQAPYDTGQPAGPALLPVHRGTCLGARGSGDCLGLAGRLVARRWAVSRRLAGSHLTCPLAYQAGTTSLLVSVDGTTHAVEAPVSYHAGGRRVGRFGHRGEKACGRSCDLGLIQGPGTTRSLPSSTVTQDLKGKE